MRLARAGAGIVAAVISTVPLLEANAVAAPRCLGRTATITGGAERVIHGTSGDDVITAYGGEHEVRAGGGNDLVCADSSWDYLHGNRGDDQLVTVNERAYVSLYGGPGDDRLEGTSTSKGDRGNDHVTGSAVSGGAGDDVLNGVDGASALFGASPQGVTVDLRSGTATGHGRDVLTGDFDHLYGSRHDDVLVGDDDVNMIFGFSGDDLISAGPGRERALYGGDGHDTIRGGAGNDELFGRAGDDRLSGGPGDDLVWPSLGDDFVSGGGGNDDVIPDYGDESAEAGDDDLHGGAGRDTVHYVLWPDPIEIDLGAGYAEGAGSDLLEGFEDATGGNGNDFLRGDDGANRLDGYDGEDRIEGSDGDDTIDGGPGIDVADGGEGIDACEDAETPISCEETQPVPSRSVRRL